MAVRQLSEMPKRGPQKKLPKYKARELAADRVAQYISNIPTILQDDYFVENYNDEEKEVIIKIAEDLCIKACKSIGRDYYSY